MRLGKKGQVAASVTENMLALLVIIAIAFVSLKVGSSLDTNLTAQLSSDTQATIAASNVSAGFYDSFLLMSLAPYLIGAIVVIVLVVGFAKLVGVGRL